MRALVAIALVACGNSAAPPPPPVAQATPADALPPIVDRVADRFAALARRLADVGPLTVVHNSVEVVHTMPAWRQASARARDYRPLELATVNDAITSLATLATKLDQAAALLLAGKVADAIASVDAAITDAFHGVWGTLPSDLVDELVWQRDELCDKRHVEGVCEQQRMMQAGFDYATETKRSIRTTLTSAAHDLAAGLPSADVHTKTVLARAVGEGPSFGEPCGPEGLCAWNNDCQVATHTCEHPCSQMAMEPCPSQHHCVSVPSLPGTYCRR